MEGFNRRVVKMHPGAQTTPPTAQQKPEESWYTYTGIHAVQESIPAPSNPGFFVIRQWTYGSGVDEVLEMTVDDGDRILPEASDARYHYLMDPLGSVVGLTDESGKLVEGYTYKPYGDVEIRVPGTAGADVEWDASDAISTNAAGHPLSPSGNVWFFTGRQYDPEIGSYHYLARQYHPGLGQFMNADPIGAWGDAGSLGNAYAYVGNNPSTNRDPSGLDFTEGSCPSYNGCNYDYYGNVVGTNPVPVQSSCYQSPLGGGVAYQQHSDCATQAETALRTVDLALATVTGVGHSLQATASAVTFGAVPAPSICNGKTSHAYYRQEVGQFGECYGAVLGFAGQAVVAPALIGRVAAAAGTPNLVRAGVGCGLGAVYHGVGGGGSPMSYAGSCAGGAVTMFGGTGATLGARVTSGLGMGLLGGALDTGVTQIGNRIASGFTCNWDRDAWLYSEANYGIGGAVGGALSPVWGSPKVDPWYGRVTYDGVVGAKVGAFGAIADRTVAPHHAGSCAG